MLSRTRPRADSRLGGLSRPLPRTHRQRHIATLDPETEHEEICRIVFAHEFPWDMNQAPWFALFRTYAVPSIGRLLDETGTFARDTRKRYDDTSLLLDEPARNGLQSERGRRAIRRIKTYPDGYEIEQLGTFPRSCPVPHRQSATL